MSRLIQYEDKQVLQEVKHTVMIGRYKKNSARPIDGSSINVIFDVEPLSNEPYALQRLDYEYRLLPDEVLFHGIDRANHYTNSFPEYYDLQGYDMDEKMDQIDRFYNNTIVLFHPVIQSSKITNKYFRNLEVIDIVDIGNSDVAEQYYMVPRVDMDQSIFELKLSNKDFFELENFSSKMVHGNKFVVCADTLYVSSFKAHPNKEFAHSWHNTATSYEKYKLTDLPKLGLIQSKKAPYVVFLAEHVFYELQRRGNDIKEESHQPVQNELVEIANEAEELENIEEQALSSFLTNVKKANLCYRSLDLLNFHVCMKAAPLVIVAGRSGTGKTRITLEYARLLDISENNQNLLFFPVSPALSDPSDLTGYYNAQTNMYVPADGGLVDFLVHAQQHQERMHMVIFDEMNLAQIEHYFASFLSIMERDENKRTLMLYNENLSPANASLYPPSLKIHQNVLFVGTVNLDETTNNLSDRLLDRCFVVNLNQQSFVEYYREQENFRFQDHPNQFLISSADLYNRMIVANEIHQMNTEVLTFLDEVNTLLNKADRQKGVSFRTLKNIGNYLANAQQIKKIGISDDEMLDLAFKQTVVKKIVGDVGSLGSVLGDERNEGTLFQVLERYAHLSLFVESRAELMHKRDTMLVYGYTSRS